MTTEHPLVTELNDFADLHRPRHIRDMTREELETALNASVILQAKAVGTIKAMEKISRQERADKLMADFGRAIDAGLDMVAIDRADSFELDFRDQLPSVIGGGR